QLWQNARRIQLPYPGPQDSPASPTVAPGDTRHAGNGSGGDQPTITGEADRAGAASGGASLNDDDTAAGEAATSSGGTATVETSAAEATEQALREIMEILRVRTRHDFRHYKRATVLRRIGRRLQVNGLPDLPSYRDHLRDHAEETTPLLQDMLISVTNFFRDPTVMSSLERTVLPNLLKGRKPDDPVRVWVVGCATGEEAYTIGILLHEQVAGLAAAPPIQIFATDIDDRAISIARNGVYPGAIANDMSPARLR